MRKIFSVSVLTLAFTVSVAGQYSLTITPYNQDFNSLANSGTSALLPPGWVLIETGTGQNTLYTADDGSSNIGDTYSYGSTGAAERALGGLLSGSLNPVFGLYVRNNTGSTITNLLISYTGEQWRLGTAGRTDQLDFEYSLNATSLTTGNWVRVNALDFIAPVTTAPTGALNGNLAANRTFISNLILGLNIPNGTNFFLRWIDHNASGADDGLGIDDFALTTVPSVPPSTEYFRSVQNGDWSQVTTWESSIDNLVWVPATIPPDFNAAIVTVSNADTVTITTFLSADEIVIENGGVLDYAGGILTIEDGPGNDVIIQNGGVFKLSQAGMPPLFGPGSPAVNILSGGILRVAATGMTGAGVGVNAGNYIYQHQSVLEFTPGLSFSTNGVTFFPNADPYTIPVFRTTSNVGLVGSAGATAFNGIFEANGDITWTASGIKTFRNGIRGHGNIGSTATSGTLKINGITAELGGSGTLTASNGLFIGSSPGTTVSLTSDKRVTGNITLDSTSDTYVDLGAHHLTVSGGNIRGGSGHSYIRTGSNDGALTLDAIDNTTPEIFPVGVTSYNPLIISNGSGHDFTVRVRTGIYDPAGAIPTDAVSRTWYIHASAVSSGVTIKFQYSNNPGELTGTATTQPSSMEILQSDYNTWHLSAGNTSILSAGGPPYMVTSVAGLTINDSPVPYTLGTTGTIILPLNSTISCSAVKVNKDGIISFDLSSCTEVEFVEIQRSVISNIFETISAIQPGINQTKFTYADHLLAIGTNNYRIKATLRGGSIKYSNTVAIINKYSGVVITSLSPNPVNGLATITVSEAKAGLASFIVYNISGMPVKQWQTVIGEGSRIIIMDAGALPSGLYHIKISMHGSGSVSHFIKQ